MIRITSKQLNSNNSHLSKSLPAQISNSEDEMTKRELELTYKNLVEQIKQEYQSKAEIQ